MILLDPSARPVIGHRGAAAHVPENTLASLAHAVQAGVDALEFDVHVTRDGVPVVHHDTTLDRTTSGTGPLANRTRAELRSLDAGAHFSADGGATFPFRGCGLTIPTLDEVLESFPHLPLLLEIKVAAASPAVRRTLDRHRAAGRVAVASFVDAAMLAFRDSPYPTGAAQGDVARLLVAALVGLPLRPTYRTASVPTRHGALPLPVGRFVRRLRPLGIPVHVWTVDMPAEARRLWTLGVSGIVSNDPAAILAERDASG